MAPVLPALAEPEPPDPAWRRWGGPQGAQLLHEVERGLPVKQAFQPSLVPCEITASSSVKSKPPKEGRDGGFKESWEKLGCGKVPSRLTAPT